MKKGVVALVAALVASLVCICILAVKLSESKQKSDEAASNHKTGVLTDELLYDDWVTEDYLIFEDGSVYSRRNFEKVMTLNLPLISYIDGALRISGDFVALQDAEDNVCVYDLTKGRKVTSLKVERQYDGPIEMSLSDDGKYLVYKHADNKAVLYDLTTGEKIREFEGWYFEKYHFSSDGRYLYSVEYQDAHSGFVDIMYFDDPSRDILVEFWGRLCPIDEGGNFLVDSENDTVVDLKHGSGVSLKIDGYFEFSHDGRYLAVETPANVVRVYDTKSWEVVFEKSFVEHSGMFFIDDDRYMLMCHYLLPEFEGHQMVDVYDTATWTLQNTLEMDTWVEDMMNLETTYVYDSISDNVVDVLSSKELPIPYAYDAIDILWTQGDLVAALLTNYADYDTLDRLLVWDMANEEYIIDINLHPCSSVFVSQTGDFLFYNEVNGAAVVTLEDLQLTSKFFSKKYARSDLQQSHRAHFIEL